MLIMHYFGKIAYIKQYPIGFYNPSKKYNPTLFSIISKSYFIIPIFVFCFFSSLRYKVGVDCENYKEAFYDTVTYGEPLKVGTSEVVYLWLTQFCSYITNTHYLYMFLLAFLEIFFLYYAFRKQTYILLYLGIALFLNNDYFYLMNGMRQCIVACSFVSMIPLIINKRWWIFILFVFLASLMHRSALMLLLISIYIYFTQRGILKVRYQLFIILICYMLMDKLDISSITNLYSLASHAGYSIESIEGYSELEAMNKNFGLTSMLLLLIYLIIVLHSKRMQRFYNSSLFNIYYNLFFIAICLYLLFYNNFTINRLLIYVLIFVPIVISLTIFALKKTKYKYNKVYLYLLFLIMTFNFLFILYRVSFDPSETFLYKFDTIIK